jgi:hypothetical protein
LQAALNSVLVSKLANEVAFCGIFLEDVFVVGMVASYDFEKIKKRPVLDARRNIPIASRLTAGRIKLNYGQ